MQYQSKTIAPAPARATAQALTTPQVKGNLMQLQSQPRALGGNMIDSVKKTKKGCKSCGS